MAAMHPAAPHHLPAFITSPGETDPFLVGSAIGLVVMIFALGSLYFRLHALPEQLAHSNASKLQFEVIGALALLALFTHNNWFWVAALLLALVPIPDLHAPLSRMAESLASLAGRRRAAVPDDEPVVQSYPESVPLRREAAVEASTTSGGAEAAPRPVEPGEEGPGRPPQPLAPTSA